MKLKQFILTIFFLSYISCTFQGNINERREKDYVEIINLYPQALVYGLPEITKHKLIVMELEFPRGKYLSFIHLAVSFTEEEIALLNKGIIPKAKRIYHFSDSCSMIVNYSSAIYDNAPFNLNMCSSSPYMLPIPNFEFLKDTDLPIDFYKNASIYVLDAEQGKFLADDYLSREGVGLPKEWLHGYTKGVAIDENIAVYWLEVW